MNRIEMIGYSTGEPGLGLFGDGSKDVTKEPFYRALVSKSEEFNAREDVPRQNGQETAAQPGDA